MSDPKVTPFADWVLLEQIKPGMTSGGLHVPESAGDTQIRGRVLAIGPNVHDVLGYDPQQGGSLKVGDIVYVLDDADAAVNVRKGVGLVKAKDIVARVDGTVHDLSVVEVPDLPSDRTIQ